jgi:hypothetical protein
MKTILGWVVAFVVLAAGAIDAQDLVGTWQGTLHAGQDLRVVVIISNDAGTLKATLLSIDQGAQRIPVSAVSREGATVHLSITGIGATFEGKQSSDGTSITGTFTQGAPLPLTLTRTTPATAWTLPEPRAMPRPMAANAPLTFEVATIKPSAPGTPGKVLTLKGRDVVTVNTSLGGLISFACDVRPKQVAGGAPWVDAEKYDITAKPEGAGIPNLTQLKMMIRSLLADRFKLSFHREKREQSV